MDLTAFVLVSELLIMVVIIGFAIWLNLLSAQIQKARGDSLKILESVKVIFEVINLMDSRRVKARAILKEFYEWRTKGEPEIRSIDEAALKSIYNVYTFANQGLMKLEKILRGIVED